jgi:predicted transcriptional regulator
MVRPREKRLNKSGRDFRALLEKAGLEQGLAAHLLGISKRTVRGYADGSRTVPLLVSRLLKAYITYGIDPAKL